MWLSRDVDQAYLVAWGGRVPISAILLAVFLIAACGNSRRGLAGSGGSSSAAGGGGGAVDADFPVPASDGPATSSGGTGGSPGDAMALSGDGASQQGGAGADGGSVGMSTTGAGGLGGSQDGGPLASGSSSRQDAAVAGAGGDAATATGGRGGDGGGTSAPGGSGPAGGGVSGVAGKDGNGGNPSPDAANTSDSRTVPQSIADELNGLLPDGQCKSQGEILMVWIDSAQLVGRTWVAGKLSLAGYVMSHSNTQDANAQVGFSVGFKAQGSAHGIWSASDVEASLAFGDVPAVACDAWTIAGAVRVTFSGRLSDGNSNEVCGVYDLTCADATGAHSVHIICSFDSVVPLSPAPGAL